MGLYIDRLTKQYDDHIVVDRVNLHLTKGIYGLVGANGAGKTSLLQMIAGVLVPSAGSIQYNGFPVASEHYRSRLGYLPQHFGYYPEFTGIRFLLYMSMLKGLSKSAAKTRSEEMLELTGLTDFACKKIRAYSGGMKQRLGIAQVFLNFPEIVILDEPTAGLDPRERIRFRNLISRLGSESIVIFSTHILSDLEGLADTILIMKQGRIIHQGANIGISQLEELYLKKYEIVERII